MLGRWALVVLLASCGRIGFEGVAPGDGGTGPGCVAQLALGQFTACVVREDGALYCWGDDTHGQLGIGRRLSSTVAGPLVTIGASDITAGDRHTCAWNASTAWCWGDNSYGQLGDGTTISKSVPASIVLAAPSWMSAGTASTCAIDGGVAKCWGKNRNGQLGDGTSIDRVAPTPVVDLGAVIQISTGVNHTCAIDTNGDVWCWGANGQGQLGTGDNNGAMRPARVANNFRAKRIAAGDQITCAIDQADRAFCWGSDANGELGDGEPEADSNVPVAVSLPAMNVVDIDVGSVHACAVLANGSARCWGRNVSRLGNGDSMSSSVPVTVMNLANAVEVTIGQNSSCARRANGTVACWGQNEGGELGNGGNSPRDTATATDSSIDGVTEIALGGFHACGVVAGGVICWGSSTFGQNGAGDTPSPLVPTRVTTGIARASMGTQHACAVTGDATLRCWGLNEARLGFDDPPEALVPTAVPDLTDVAQVTAGGEMTCSRDGAGVARCWGAGRLIGSNASARTAAPTPVVGVSSVRAILAGESHTCAIDAATGAVACWGAGGDGRLGSGTTTDALVATPVVDLASATALSLANRMTCAIDPARQVWCWGNAENGQLVGASTDVVNRRPIALGLFADEIAVGDSHVCSRTGTELTCWGNNAFGMLADPSYTSARAPGPVPGVSARTIASGGEYTCAITTDDDLVCWGRNHYGQLGDGTTLDRSEPRIVDVPCD